jgi:hypothetical protein
VRNHERRQTFGWMRLDGLAVDDWLNFEGVDSNHVRHRWTGFTYNVAAVRKASALGLMPLVDDGIPEEELVGKLGAASPGAAAVEIRQTHSAEEAA